MNKDQRCRTLLIWGRAVWGSLLLISGGDDHRSRSVSIGARVLGARQLVEAVILTAERSDPPPRWPIVVDGLHALSMVALASISPRLRRDATKSALAALAFLVLTATCSGRG
jgi:hypothetical protein